jgi:hypothetical protein
MEREIRVQMMRMAGVMLVAFALAAWQHHFLMIAINANIYLNGLIFGTFFFAAFLAFRSVSSLKDDVLALNALRADFGSVPVDQKEVLARKAVVFGEPKLLGHAYRQITEEMFNRQKLNLTTDTVHLLVASVDQRISERKNTIMYFSGLMVFLGLFGTFVGLMETVDSVGAVIGNLNLSGGQSADDAFGKLIEGLKAPLNGMATGFGSSLFGLVTSLILGIFDRFATGAWRAVKMEFESWLTDLSSLEAGKEGEEAELATDGVLHQTALNTVRRLARLEAQNSQTGVLLQSSSKSISDLVGGIHALNQVMTELIAERRKPSLALTNDSQMLMEQQRMLTSHAASFMTALADERSAMGYQLASIRDSLESLANAPRGQVTQALWYDDPVAVVAADEVESAQTVQIKGARGLWARLRDRLAPQAAATGEGISEGRAMSRLAASVSMQQARIESMLQDMDKRRERENGLARRSLAQQEQLLAVLTVLIQKATEQKQQQDVSEPLQQLQDRVAQQQVAFEVALRRIESQLQQTQDMTQEAAMAAREAAESFSYQRAVNS